LSSYTLLLRVILSIPPTSTLFPYTTLFRSKEPPQFKNILVNIVVSGLLIVGLPSLMSTMQDMSLKFYEGTQTGSNNNGTTSLARSEEHTSELQSRFDLVCRLLLEKKKRNRH